jgi:uncharacterized protein (DUF433 family)
MSGTGCEEAMALLNVAFTTAFILNDGHEILARLNAGEDAADIVTDYCVKSGKEALGDEVSKVMRGWPHLHMEAVTQLVRWALGKLDSDDRITIQWKGDAESPETVTRFELRDHTLVVEFAHPQSLFA